MDNATAGAVLWLFLVIALTTALFWDRVGRRLWYDAVDASRDFAHWFRTRPWADAFSALRTGHIPGGALPSLPVPAPVVRLPRDYVAHEAVPPRSDAVPPGTGTGTGAERDAEPLDRTARDAAVAEAMGRLMARGLLAEADRVKAMEALFGPRGRRWQHARPIIEQAVRDAAPARATPLAGRPIPPGVTFEE